MKIENKKQLIVEKYPHKRYVMVNLPESEKGYENGNGEGIWAYIADDTDLEKYRKNESEGKIKVLACNDSIYYFGLIVYGDEIEVELRGDNRPVADFFELQKLIDED